MMVWFIGCLWCVLPVEARRHQPVVPDSLQVIETEVNGIPLRLRRVEGGSFLMGATVDQYDADIYSDKPAHLVLLSPYYIAETEITCRLWRSVMPETESLQPRGYNDHPVAYVSWHDCQEFIRRLDSITGLPFRLPTEAQWEYAARGGQHSRHYRFAGSHIADSVGWTNSCSGNWSHPVARKQPNELGLYDMTGNVAEWCEDRYAPYDLGTAPDPCVCDTGRYKIVRGGSYDDCVANSHLSLRRWYAPETSNNYIGFRVAFTLPGDPMMQTVTEDPPLVRKVRIKGRRLHLALVPAEQPYYISDEISSSLWRKIMRTDPPDYSKSIAIGMSPAERKRFAELCSREAQTVLQVASAEETVAAETAGVIEPFLPDVSHRRRSQTVRQIQKKRQRNAKWSALTEMVGVRLPVPDDPVLLQYKRADDLSRPLRLVIRL